MMLNKFLSMFEQVEHTLSNSLMIRSVFKYVTDYGDYDIPLSVFLENIGGSSSRRFIKELFGLAAILGKENFVIPSDIRSLYLREFETFDSTLRQMTNVPMYFIRITERTRAYFFFHILMIDLRVQKKNISRIREAYKCKEYTSPDIAYYTDIKKVFEVAAQAASFKMADFEWMEIHQVAFKEDILSFKDYFKRRFDSDKLLMKLYLKSLFPFFIKNLTLLMNENELPYYVYKDLTHSVETLSLEELDSLVSLDYIDEEDSLELKSLFMACKIKYVD